MGRLPPTLACALVAASLLPGCRRQEAVAPPPVRVAVEAAREEEFGPVVMLTGEVVARVSSDLSFRIAGRVAERTAEVGNHVRAGQVLATLDPTEQQAGVVSAQADVRSAEAQLSQAASNFERQRALIGPGFTTRREYDQAVESLRSARGALDVAKAQLGIAQDRLNQTVLRANEDGIVTARNVEAGQVVQETQAAYTVARDGPRDAVFNVYESLLVRGSGARTIRVALVSNPNVAVEATVREISPVVDSATGTVKVKFELADAPGGAPVGATMGATGGAMGLGAAVTGTGRLRPRRGIALPWTAMSSMDGGPAVWLVDPVTKVVSPRPVVVASYEKARFIVEKGLDPGQTVVSRGAQLLYPGRIVDPRPVDVPSVDAPSAVVPPAVAPSPAASSAGTSSVETSPAAGPGTKGKPAP